jgi:hypothetical protein
MFFFLQQSHAFWQICNKNKSIDFQILMILSGNVIDTIPNVQSSVSLNLLFVVAKRFQSGFFVSSVAFPLPTNFPSFPRFLVWDYMINEWTPFICSVKSVYIGFTDFSLGDIVNIAVETEKKREIEIPVIMFSLNFFLSYRTSEIIREKEFISSMATDSSLF